MSFPLKSRRRGMVLLAVMVCLAVVLALIVSWLRFVAVEQRLTRHQQLRLQATWLAESALSRAAARLATDENYGGEIWKLPAEEIGSADEGEVLIRVEPVAGNPQRRQIFVQADYPIDPSRRNRHSRSIAIDLSSSGGSS